MTSALDLLEEAARTPFRGWDFSWLSDRISVEPPPWSFDDVVAGLIVHAGDMLDMGTGGGEWLISLPRRPPRTVATEAWKPNVPIAADRLLPLGDRKSVV